MNMIIRALITVVIAILFFAQISSVSDARSTPEVRPLQEQVTPLTKELLNTKVPHFYCFEYRAQPQPGKRYWLRVSNSKWIERYPDGSESIFRVLGHGTVKDMLGTIVFKVTGMSLTVPWPRTLNMLSEPSGYRSI